MTSDLTSLTPEKEVSRSKRHGHDRVTEGVKNQNMKIGNREGASEIVCGYKPRNHASSLTTYPDMDPPGSTTSNLLTTLSGLKDIGDIPYTQAVPHILSMLIGIHQEFDECEEEWTATMQCIKRISTSVDEILAEQNRNDNGEGLAHVICSSLDKYQSLDHEERLKRRGELQDEAKKMTSYFNLNMFQMHLIPKNHLNIGKTWVQCITSILDPGPVSSPFSESGSGGCEEHDGIGGNGGGIGNNNLQSKLVFSGGIIVGTGDGGGGKNIGKGGCGGAICSDNINSTQYYRGGSLKSGEGGMGDGGFGGAGGNIGVRNVDCIQEYSGYLKTGSGGASTGLGSGGHGGSIGTENQNMDQCFLHVNLDFQCTDCKLKFADTGEEVPGILDEVAMVGALGVEIHEPISSFLRFYIAQ
ncbi:hypothetical protein K435DRAFT_915205 [Dendrothele bispora CBS 962.96]|uniref:Uncharacterized protein n=1 Tax=Dendrothele bispora (strain CBS 962.96) TaxID=1314807 RepID=A0A4S8LJB3_DENBC|nr:hypothetical protein K435DRAFT_915205 [Dendrothele bispora CBS 962.96]